MSNCCPIRVNVGTPNRVSVEIGTVRIVPQAALQDKTVVPTLDEQTVTADPGYDGLGMVTVLAIPYPDAEEAFF